MARQEHYDFKATRLTHAVEASEPTHLKTQWDRIGDLEPDPLPAELPKHPVGSMLWAVREAQQGRTVCRKAWPMSDSLQVTRAIDHEIFVFLQGQARLRDVGLTLDDVLAHDWIHAEDRGFGPAPKLWSGS